ncbi:hypothetical protein Q6348_01200 [Isoptericola sp. b441]|uniref:Peptidase metallopeptidase domain-containing protein n=1 Tax=Actinotalea lenta TaxID=3064654 RepID=A0ABT9D4Z5_9CELL|nr:MULTISPECIES: hypothetical protein [unclassified Isoptericola]MDO8105810.1 hypothetical protein [Isoptericola sp. b441]MDO8122515.1 hypothetical protein [Isoptericola sp. b490]
MTAERIRRRRTALVAVLAVVVAGWAAPAVAGTAELVGTVQRLVVDVGDGTDVDLTAVVPDSGGAVRVADGVLADVPTGSTVTVRLGAVQAADQDPTTADAGAPAQLVDVTAPAQGGASQPDQGLAELVPGSISRTVQVLTATLPGQTADTIRPADLATDLSSAVAPYWSDSTGGAVVFTAGAQVAAGSYADWGGTGSCTTAQVIAFLSWTAGKAGVAPTVGTGRHTITYTPRLPSCPFAGVANLSSGGSAWINGAGSTGERQVTEAHELGHTLGLGHSNVRYACPDAADGSADQCTDVTYGDAYDVMGLSIGGVGPLSGAQLDTLGLLDAASMRDVTGSADVTIAPVGGGTGLRFVRFTTGDATYYVEYRGAVGRDADLATTRRGCPTGTTSCSRARFLPGVIVHRVDQRGLGAQTWLLAAGPNGSFVIPAGQSFETADGQVRVTVADVTTSGATIQVARAAATPPVGDGGFQPVDPTRLLNRVTLGPQSTYTFSVPGAPAGAIAVALNLTVTNVHQTSYLSACAAGTPLAVCRSTSVLNPTAGVDTASAATVALGGANGNQVTVYNHAGTLSLIVDVQGYYVPGASATSASSGALFEARPPSRAMDQRLGAGQLVTLSLGQVPAGASAVALNTTSSAATAIGYVSVCPAGQALATCRSTSNVNPVPGRDIANFSVVKLGGPYGNQLQVYNKAGSTRVIVDVAGYYVPASATGGALDPIVPVRALNGQPMGRGATTTLTLSGAPAGATAAVLNLTSTATTGVSYVSACPAGMALSSCVRTSAFNPVGGVDSSNTTVVALGGATHNQVLLYNNGASMSLIVDVVGYVVPPR